MSATTSPAGARTAGDGIAVEGDPRPSTARANRGAWPGLHAAPMHREIDQLTGARRPSAFFRALDATDTKIAEAQRQAVELATFNEALEWAAESAPYRCQCGESFDYPDEAGIEDYAALNRWLGRHERCES